MNRDSEELFYFVTGGGLDYHWQDILDVICYPIGYQVSFAYEKWWMASNTEPIEGAKVLVVFYDPVLMVGADIRDLSLRDANLDGVTKEDEFQFFPIRYAEIVEPKQESGALTIGLRLGEFVDYTGKDVEKRLGEMTSHLKQAAPDLPKPHVPILEMAQRTKLVWCDQQSPLTKRKYGYQDKVTKGGEHGWISLARYLVNKSHSLRYVSLCCLFSRRNEGQPRVPLKLKKSSTSRDIGMVVLNAGSHYELVVTIICSASAIPARPSLKSVGDKTLNISEPVHKQRGPGVDFVWKLFATEGSLNQSGSLIFETAALEPRTSLTSLPASVQSRLKIVGPKMVLTWQIRQSVTPIVLLLLGVAVGFTLAHQGADMLDSASKFRALGVQEQLHVVADRLIRLFGVLLAAWCGVFLLKKGVSKAMGV